MCVIYQCYFPYLGEDFSQIDIITQVRFYTVLFTEMEAFVVRFVEQFMLSSAVKIYNSCTILLRPTSDGLGFSGKIIC